MTNSMTKRNFFEALVSFVEDGIFEYNTEDAKVEVTAEDMVEYAKASLATLDRANERARARAAEARENKVADELTYAVYDAMSEEFETVEDIMLRVDADTTVSKVRYRINALIKDGRAEKTDMKVDKRTVKGYRRISKDAE